MASSNAVVGSKETTVVKLSADGKGAPTNIDSVTDTTLVRGVTLVKSQAIDDMCDGTADTDFSSSADPLAATPGQCVIYQILATNTSSTERGFDINDLIITDPVSNFTGKANYQINSATTTVTTGSSVKADGEANNDGTNVNTTIEKLAPQGLATMQFSVKIKTDRATS